ncbi:MAG: hypothetical protein DRP08_02980 [Candidatus Aenigmatarchaeota archaeon]|nr:MAG: hypothetical protein DRP08_02980 [Candidatus Aenigmarchaeota archaeon]
MSVDTPENSCIFCQFFSTNINDDPCNPCLHSGKYPGRDRPLFLKKVERKSPNVEEPKKVANVEEPKKVANVEERAKPKFRRKIRKVRQGTFFS